MKVDTFLKKYKNILLLVVVAVIIGIGISKIHTHYRKQRQEELSKVQRYKEIQEVALEIKGYKQDIERIKKLFYTDSYSIVSAVDKYARQSGVEVVSLNPLDAQLFDKDQERVFSTVVNLDIQSNSIDYLLGFLNILEVEEDKLLTVQELTITGVDEKSIQARMRVVGGVLKE